MYDIQQTYMICESLVSFVSKIPCIIAINSTKSVVSNSTPETKYQLYKKKNIGRQTDAYIYVWSFSHSNTTSSKCRDSIRMMCICFLCFKGDDCICVVFTKNSFSSIFHVGSCIYTRNYCRRISQIYFY